MQAWEVRRALLAGSPEARGLERAQADCELSTGVTGMDEGWGLLARGCTLLSGLRGSAPESGLGYGEPGQPGLKA